MLRPMKLLRRLVVSHAPFWDHKNTEGTLVVVKDLASELARYTALVEKMGAYGLAISKLQPLLVLSIGRFRHT